MAHKSGKMFQLHCGFLIIILWTLFTANLGDGANNFHLRRDSMHDPMIRNAEDCLEAHHKEHVNETVEITRWNYGRLGNCIQSARNAIAYALYHNCHVRLPKQLVGLPNFIPNRNFFCASNLYQLKMARHSNNSKAVCNIHVPSEYWFDYKIESNILVHPIVEQQLHMYLGINQTHTFNLPCQASQPACFGVHIRSGDVFRGVYNATTGHYMPTGYIHSAYEQPPLEYYLMAIKMFLERHSGQQGNSTIKVACEDMNNPVCEIFKILSATVSTYEMLDNDFLLTLHQLTCCEEIALSVSTLSIVLLLSPHIKHVHHHIYRKDMDKGLQHNCSNDLIRSESTYLAEGYVFADWHNTEVERHHLLQPYKMKVNTCVVNHTLT